MLSETYQTRPLDTENADLCFIQISLRLLRGQHLSRNAHLHGDQATHVRHSLHQLHVSSTTQPAFTTNLAFSTGQLLAQRGLFFFLLVPRYE